MVSSFNDKITILNLSTDGVMYLLMLVLRMDSIPVLQLMDCDQILEVILLTDSL